MATPLSALAAVMADTDIASEGTGRALEARATGAAIGIVAAKVGALATQAAHAGFAEGAVRIVAFGALGPVVIARVAKEAVVRQVARHDVIAVFAAAFVRNGIAPYALCGIERADTRSFRRRWLRGAARRLGISAVDRAFCVHACVELDESLGVFFVASLLCSSETFDTAVGISAGRALIAAAIDKALAAIVVGLQDIFATRGHAAAGCRARARAR